MKKIIIYIYLLMISVLYADFEVAPKIQKIDLDRSSTKKIHLKNPTDKLKKLKIYSERPKDQKTKDFYMGDWIIVYPKIVYLKPKSKKIIRMAARPPKGLADGEYRSHLVIEELPVQVYNNVEENKGEKSVEVEIFYKILSTIYGYKGKLEYSGIFDGFKFVTDKKKTYLVSKITNTGTTALEVYYKITYYKDMKELKSEELRAGKVMRENYLDSILELNNVSKGVDKITLGIYYRVNKDSYEEEGYEEFKLGEKTIPIEKTSIEEFLKELKEKNKKEMGKEKIEGKNKEEKSEEEKDS